MPQGTVIGQFPPAGAVAGTGFAVTLVVSRGPVAVPDVVGRPATEATAMLSELELVAAEADGVDVSAPEGSVLATLPPPGTHVPRHSTVTLIVNGPSRP